MAETVGERVARLRLDRQISQNGLAEMVGTSATYIQRLEAGQIRVPGVAKLQALAQALTTTVGELLGSEDFDLAVHERQAEYQTLTEYLPIEELPLLVEFTRRMSALPETKRWDTWDRVFDFVRLVEADVTGKLPPRKPRLLGRSQEER